jgi:hypothetical protein
LASFSDYFRRRDCYSPQKIEKSDSKQLSLATTSILGQPPRWNKLEQWLLISVIFMVFVTGCSSRSFDNRLIKPLEVSNIHDQLQETTVFGEPGAVEFYNNRETITKNDPLRLSNEKKVYPVNKVERLQPLLELGDPFLGNGPIQPGIKTPTGQMLQPWFLLYGTFRTALQSYDNGDVHNAEWSNRLDLHGNLNLSGTERLVFSMRPLDDEDGNYTGYNFTPDSDDGWQEDFNANLTQLFFEGEIGEIFPGLDSTDSGTFDLGFSVGRQSLDIQDGILLNDIIDMVGFTRNSLVFNAIPNMRVTGVYGWNGLNRGVENIDDTSQLVGLFSEMDTSWGSTVSLDFIYVDDKESSNAFYLGAGTTQRIGALNSTFRINTSIPEHEDNSAVSSGILLTSELSSTLQGSDNIVYFNTFWSIDQFTSAGRGPDQGSPVANLGVLYSPVGMSRYDVPLGQPIADTVGTALGYQVFVDGIKSQIILELGARMSTKSSKQEGVLGIGARYQRAIGKRHILRFDAFAVTQESDDPSYGIRSEWLIKF